MQTATTRPESLRELASTLFIYKWMILLSTAVVGGAAVTCSILQPPIWEASVKVWAQDQSAGLRKGEPSADLPTRLKIVLTNLRELIYSRSVLEAAWMEAAATDAAERRATPAVSAAQLDQLRKAVRIEAPRGFDFGTTQIFFLRLRDRDPERAERLVQAILHSFQQRYTELSAEQAKHLYEETTAQVAKSRGTLRETERTLESFIATLGSDLPELQSMAGSPGGESDLRKTLSAVNERLVREQSDLRERSAFLDQVRASRGETPATVPVPSSFLREYLALEQAGRAMVDARLNLDLVAARATASHPDYETAADRLGRVEQTYREELDRAVDALEQDVAARAEAVATLAVEKAGLVQRTAHLSGRSIDYGRLVEELRRQREIVAEAEKRRSDAAHAQLTAAQDLLLSTVDPPQRGNRPVSPRPGLNLMVGTLLGLLIGVGLAFLARQHSQRVRSEADLATVAEDLVIVSVPRVHDPLHKAV